MIFVPLLHYFKCKNSYSGNEEGMRYLLTPGKRKVPDLAGGEGAEKEEEILMVEVWPGPWTIDMTDPELRRKEIYPLSDEGREEAAKYLKETYEAETEFWKHRPSILDCDPWTPPAPEKEVNA